MNFYNVTLPQNIPNGRWISSNPELAKKLCQGGAKLGVGDLPETEYVSKFYHPLGWDAVPDLRIKANENSISVFESDLGGFKQQTVINELDNDAQTKAVYKKRGYGVQHEVVQTQAKDGTFKVQRYHGGSITGYEFKPLQRKLATTGWRAMLEKLAFKIGLKSNGCERPVLRNVAGFILKQSQKFV